MVVGADEALRKQTFEVENVNWVSIAPPAETFRAAVKIRHKHEPAPATVEPLDETRARITFDAPQRAITPGQAAVFYDSDDSGEGKNSRILAGAWIR